MTFLMAAEHEEQLAEILALHGVPGCELVDRGPGRVEVTLYPPGPGAGPLDALGRDLGLLADGDLRVETRENEDWLALYRKGLSSFRVGRTWWIDPEPEPASDPPEGRTRLAIEPRMAFGTGSHASTHLVLLELEEHPPTGLKVLDIGTGSGVLSLASEVLGALWTVGFDIDTQAVFVARDAVADQTFECSPAYFAGPLGALGGACFDLVLCNMLSSEFGPLLESIRAVMDGGSEAVFSGILTDEQAAVEKALRRAGFAILGVRLLDEWLAIRARAV
jgi:ribosomal protein L11 methyltransferase